MIQGTDDLLTRIGEVAQKLGAIHQAMGETLVAVAGKDGRELDARELRAFGHGLVSLAGDLTLLGVEMALRADELD